MSFAQPYTRATERRFQSGLVLSLLAFNGLVILLVMLAGNGTFKDNGPTPAPDEQNLSDALSELKTICRPNSVLHYYVDMVQLINQHQNESQDQLEALYKQFLNTLPPIVWVKFAGIALLFFLIFVLVVGLGVYGVVRYLRGPPLRRRWQRWQRGVVSPLPIWALLAACFLTVAGLMALRATVHLPKSVLMQLAIWEAAQALLVAGLLFVATTQTGLKPLRDFGFGRETGRSIRAGLKYYFPLLPVFWAMSLGGAMLYGLVYTAAGSPKELDEAGRASIDQLFSPTNGNWGPAALFIAAVLLAPLFEELFFRGFLFGSLRRWLSAPAAMVISAAVFAAMHPMQNHLPIFFLGMFLAYTYEKTGNLGASMAVHFTHNLIVMLLMGMAIL